MAILDSITRPSFRVSEQLAAGLTWAGGSSAAIKALIVIGLAEAGYDITPMAREIKRLAATEDVSDIVAARLEQLLGRAAVAGPPPPPPPEPPPAADAGDVFGLGEFV